MGQIAQYQVVIPGQLITAALWNGMESNIINNGLIPAGIDSYAATDGDYQTQVDPFPASVLSRPTNLQEELTRIRYSLNAITGKTYHYEPPTMDMEELGDLVETHDHSGGAEGPQLTDTGLATGAVVEAKIGAGAVTVDKIGADAVNGSKIADDSIDSEHYVAGSIDAEHLSANSVETAKIADANVTEAKLASEVVNKMGQNIGFVLTNGGAGTLVNYTGQGRLKGITAAGGGAMGVTVVLDGATLMSNQGVASGYGIGMGSSGFSVSADFNLGSLDLHFRTSLVVSCTGVQSVYVAYERAA